MYIVLHLVANYLLIAWSGGGKHCEGGRKVLEGILLFPVSF